MERTLTQEDRIRRAQEIYLRRRNSRENVIERRNISRDTVAKEYPTIKGLKMFKRRALQIVICLLLYCIFYLIYDTNYSFSEATINKTEEILNYDINFETMYKYINDKMINLFNIQGNDNNEKVEQTNSENQKEQINGEESKIIEEEQQEMAQSIETENKGSEIKEERKNEENNQEQKEENKLILPVSGGYVSSEFGARESTSEIVSTNHKGIDIAVVERYRCSFSNVWPCYKSNGV